MFLPFVSDKTPAVCCCCNFCFSIGPFFLI
jgi:hypothetical protein